MKIECTPQELKELLKKEQTECKSECSITLPEDKMKNIIFEILTTDDKHRAD